MAFILSMFIVFFILLYAVCEKFKYRRTVFMKNGTYKKLYFEPVCYIKLGIIILDFILVIVYRIVFGVVERSAGFMSVIYLTMIYALITLPSIVDIYRIRHGYNDKLLENEV